MNYRTMLCERFPGVKLDVNPVAAYSDWKWIVRIKQTRKSGWRIVGFGHTEDAAYEDACKHMRLI